MGENDSQFPEESQSQAKRSWDQYLSRRRALQATGAGLASFVAGCSGGKQKAPEDVVGTTSTPTSTSTESGDGGDQTQTTAGDQVVQATLKDVSHNWMDTANLNTFAGSTAGGLVWRLFPPLANWASAGTFYAGGEKKEKVRYDTFRAGSAKEWSVDGKKMTITLRDDWKWTSGEPVTSADLVTRLKLEEYFNHAIWNFTSQVYSEDDKTVALEFDGEYSPSLIKHTLFNPFMSPSAPPKIDGKETIFKKSLEKLKDASTDEEKNKILNNLSKYKWNPGDLALPGAWEVESVKRNLLTLARHDGFYDPVNFSNLTIRTVGLGQSPGGQQAILTKQSDLGPVLSPEQFKSASNDLKLGMREGSFGIGVGFNYDKPGGGPLADRNIHRALAYVIKNQNARRGSNPILYGSAEYPNTNIIAANQAKNILGDQLGEFESYGHNLNRAKSLMQKAGYTKQDGTWVDENGDPLKFTLKTASWDWYPELGQIVASAWKSFGVDVSLKVLGSSAYAGMMWGSKDFEAAFALWGGAHPYPAFKGQFGDGNYWNVPKKLEVPMPIGDPNGSLETMNVREMIKQVPQYSGKKLNETVTKLSWAFNQTLPVIPLVTENMGNSYWKSDQWNFPDHDASIWGVERHHELLTGFGRVSANEK